MINLVYCGNAGIFKGISMSLLSAQKTTTEPLNVLILTGYFSSLDPRFVPFGEEQRNVLEKALRKYNPSSCIRVEDVTVLFNKELASSPNCQTSYTPYALLRLLLDQVSASDKLLYLDADTIVMKDLSALFSLELGSNYCAAVLDRYGHIWISPHYCNTGVVLLNMPLIKKDGVFASCRSLLLKKRYSFPDQAVINIVTKGKKIYLPKENNEQKKLRPETVIRHYCNQPRIFPYVHAMIAKPWDLPRIHKVYKTTVHDALYEECALLWKELGL